MSEYKKLGLGRRAKEDTRDQGYQIKTLLRAAAVPFATGHYKYWWANGWWGDQGAFPHCVAFAWVHWLEDAPITHAPRAPGAPTPFNTDVIYRDAQRVDEWPGEGYAGTSVRAGAKVLRSLGLISAFHWAFDLDTTVDAIMELGPVVIGCNWYRDMFNPGSDGFLKVSGPSVGGHAFVLNGANLAKGFVRMKNSWGRNWGKNGYSKIHMEDLEKLIKRQGEVCIATEIPT